MIPTPVHLPVLFHLTVMILALVSTRQTARPL